MDEKLSDMQAKFVEGLTLHDNATEAARHAGYAYPEIVGYRLRKKFSELVAARVREKIGENAGRALQVVLHLATDTTGKVPPNVRLAAARDILDRAGYTAVQKVEHTASDNLLAFGELVDKVHQLVGRERADMLLVGSSSTASDVAPKVEPETIELTTPEDVPSPISHSPPIENV